MIEPNYDLDDCESGQCHHIECAIYRIRRQLPSPHDYRILRSVTDEFSEHEELESNPLAN